MTPHTRAHIVTAATAIFRRFGFKQTSMGRIASEAGVARGTLYSHFPSKEEVFVAVAEETCRRILEDARSAMKGREALGDRLARMLEAKFTLLFTMMVQTPHALELLETQLRLCGAIVRRTDAAYLALLEQVLTEARRSKEISLARAGLSVPAAARWLMTAARGADTDAKTEQEQRAHVARVVQVFLSAARE